MQRLYQGGASKTLVGTDASAASTSSRTRPGPAAWPAVAVHGYQRADQSTPLGTARVARCVARAMLPRAPPQPWPRPRWRQVGQASCTSSSRQAEASTSENSPRRGCSAKSVRLAQNMQVGPCIPGEYSYKRLKLAQLLGKLGVFFACGGIRRSADQQRGGITRNRSHNQTSSAQDWSTQESRDFKRAVLSLRLLKSAD